ncbi:hypothetical protein TNCV_2072321 [Trichonephila clavipes]|nr:hypothetical protein TNCV_2072321 [Trichonephila clavipes]
MTNPRAAENPNSEIPGVNHVHSPAPSLSQAKLIIFDLLVVKTIRGDSLAHLALLAPHPPTTAHVRLSSRPSNETKKTIPNDVPPRYIS